MKKLLCLVIGLLALSSCKNDTDGIVPEIILVNAQNQYHFSREGERRLVIRFDSNTDFEVVIPPEARAWLSIVPDTRGTPLYRNTYTFRIERMTGSAEACEAVITFRKKDTAKEIFIRQSNVFRLTMKASDKLGEMVREKDIEQATALVIDGPVETLDFGLIRKAKNLREIDLVNTAIKKIERNTFAGRADLKSVKLPATLTSIGAYAFQNCRSLSSLELPESLFTIEEYAFSHCTGLKDVDFPEHMLHIRPHAFAGCTKLNPVVLPDMVTEVGEAAFSGCTELKSVHFPASLTDIGNYAFANCSALESAAFPETLANIGNYAFSDCTGLVSVTFPEKSRLISIKPNAFSNCSSLTSIKLPGRLSGIGSGAFYSCTALTEAELPASLSNVERESFGYCNALALVVCHATEPPALAEDAFRMIAAGAVLKVPASSVDIYKEPAKGWTAYFPEERISAY